MGAHDGAVDHRILVVGIGREMLKDALPDARFGPAAEAAMHRHAIAKALWQIPPRHAGPEPVEHRFDEQTVVGCGYADRTFPARQQVLDPLPLVIAKGVATHRSASKADRLGIEQSAAPESVVSLPTPIPQECCSPDSPPNRRFRARFDDTP
jgi:hypothetical protein